MTFFEAILLGLIQGLTEFLPISSTAHLTLAGKLMGLINSHTPGAWTEFMAIVQMGTLAAVVVYFSRDLFNIMGGVVIDMRSRLGGTLPDTVSDDARTGYFVLIGTVPVAVTGLLFSKGIHGPFTKSTPVIIASLVVLAALLWLAEKVARHVRTLSNLTTMDAIVVGVAQALALIPGSSRSGTTITAGLFLNFTREAAARFSFLLSIPAILASGAYELLKLDGEVAQFGYGNLAIATLVAGVSGYMAITWLLKFLSRNSTMLFVWYRFALGLVLVLLLRFGMIQP
ncbi:MAG: undecaprenyl-diphosphatase UppP [Bacteroidota bacterium]